MALKLLYAETTRPIGFFDGYDNTYLNIGGGEVGRLINVPYTYPPGASADRAAYDVFDGYAPTQNTRVAITQSLPATAATYRPLFLLDEGTSGYGVMIGVLVGGVAGQVVPNPSVPATGTNVGPHTALGSGKVTCWGPGVYAVTTDVLAASLTNASNIAGGDPLYADINGHLTATAGESFDTTSGAPTIVGRFIEFSTNGSLVTTPNYLTGAVQMQLTQMVFHFRVEN